MSAEALCLAAIVVIRPEDNQPVEVCCEGLFQHESTHHHGHIYYKENDGTVTSRCVTWRE